MASKVELNCAKLLFSCKVLDFTLNFSLKKLVCANVKEQAIVKSAQKKSQVFQRKYRKTWLIKEDFL